MAIMLTTKDNPWNPFESYDQWYTWDTTVGKHNCCGLIARLAETNDAMSEEETTNAVVEAIWSIISSEFINKDENYVIVSDNGMVNSKPLETENDT